MSDTTNQGGPPAAETLPAPSGPPPGPGVAAALPSIAAERAAAARQHSVLLFSSLAIFLASVCMPIEGGFPGRAQPLDLYAKDSIAGAFLTVFAAYGVVAGWMNLHGRRAILWPVYFAAIYGLYVTVTRALGMVEAAGDTSRLDFRGWVHLFGGGLYVIASMSLLALGALFSVLLDLARKAAAAQAAQSPQSSQSPPPEPPASAAPATE